MAHSLTCNMSKALIGLAIKDQKVPVDFTLKDIKNLLDFMCGWHKEYSCHDRTSIAGFVAKERGKDHVYLNALFDPPKKEPRMKSCNRCTLSNDECGACDHLFQP